MEKTCRKSMKLGMNCRGNGRVDDKWTSGVAVAQRAHKIAAFFPFIAIFSAIPCKSPIAINLIHFCRFERGLHPWIQEFSMDGNNRR
ncbi:MAG: hypothetical protein LBG65_06490 [Puniceicoccales bacterium]|nr:hypothetical protein [Puniceicoccales bacterium]